MTNRCNVCKCFIKDKHNCIETRKKISVSLKGRKKPIGFGDKISKSKIGNKNPNWKGNGVSYKVLHSWVRRHKILPERCVKCNNGQGSLEWSNISREYKRDLNDFEALCKFCHRKQDSGGNAIKNKYGQIY